MRADGRDQRLLGLLRLRPAKVALGLVLGAAVGAVLHALDEGVQPALVAATVMLACRAVAAVVFRDRPLVAIVAEEVPAAELRYVVPFEARSRYVRADYVEQLAHVRAGRFTATRPMSGSSRRSTACTARPSTSPACTR